MRIDDPTETLVSLQAALGNLKSEASRAADCNFIDGDTRNALAMGIAEVAAWCSLAGVRLGLDVSAAQRRVDEILEQEMPDA